MKDVGKSSLLRLKYWHCDDVLIIYHPKQGPLFLGINIKFTLHSVVIVWSRINDVEQYSTNEICILE